MVMEDCTESCSSRVVENYAPVNRGNKRQREKADVYLEVLHRLKELNVEEAKDSSFQDDLWAHFNRLTLRYALYALDMNIEKAEDVLMHKRLLQMAQNPATRPAIEVRVVQGTSTGNSGDFIHSTTSRRIDAPSSGSNSRDKSSFMIEKKKHKGLVENANIFSPVSPLSVLPSLAHPLLSHVEVALQGTNLHFQDSDGSTGSDTSNSGPRHEITISTNDMPKFLSQLTSLMSGMGLNIHEAHAFSTVDGYSLDVFVVDGWKDGGSEELKASLIKEIQMIEKSLSPKHHIIYDADKQEQNGFKRGAKLLNGHDDGSDSWEIDASLLRFEKKIASGSYGDLYKCTYYSQDVAIKVFSTEHLNKSAQQEFAQEVYIMRKIRHKNVVQFIGACTRPPSLCIVTEYMPGGSVFEFLHKQQDVLKLSTLLKWAIDVSNGMNYLHQHKIIHRDLKTANLLMDENNVVKIADFGVAKVQTQPGVMTAETGTYRWMAPEVIEHTPYDHKADVFSFGIVLWELLTGKLPYEELTPLQAAIGVVHKGLRPKIPSHTHPVLEKLLTRCWQRDPSLRPDFSEIVEILKHISNTT